MPDIRILLNDRSIGSLKPAETGNYRARDTELKGFFVIVGKRRKSFAVQGDLRKEGERASSISVRFGDPRKMSTREARAIAKRYLGLIADGIHPKPEAMRSPNKNEDTPEVEQDEEVVQKGVTLKEAWERYRDAHLIRKGRSEGTIENYRDHVERLFEDWLEVPLGELANDPARVILKHDEITRENGPYIANGSMRSLRAIYNHARKANRNLPADNPAAAVDWNPEARRNTAMGLGDLPHWFRQAAALQNPIRREFHLFSLLSGCRPTALMEARQQDLDLNRRVLHIPRPKGGADRAFDIPLSRPMILCLMRLIRFGRHFYPREADYWMFPAESESGHLAEHKEDREILAKWGNELRQTFRTLAAPAGVSPLDAHLLMNHAVPGTNAGYISRHKLLEDHLRAQQQAISNLMLGALGDLNLKDKAVRAWLGPRSARLALEAARLDKGFRETPSL